MSNRFSLRVPRLRTTALGRGIIGLVAVTMLCSACLVPPYPKDPRFAAFTYETDEAVKVQERVDSFNGRIPKLGATEGHVVVARFRDGSWIPAPDYQYWMTGVATVPDTTIAMLTDDNNGGSSLLPGIHPSLYKYVPKECSFEAVDPDVANKVLGADRADIYSEWGSFKIQSFAVSANCNLIIVTGDGINA